MEAELRWILVVVGIVVIGAIYYFGDPKRRAKAEPKARREPAVGGEPLDDNLEEELERLGDVISQERPGGEAAVEAGSEAADAVGQDPDRVVVLYVKAPRGTTLGGPDIFEAAEKVGLSYGDLNIFHRLNETGERHTAIYSLANITKPGDFDLTRRDTLQTPGLCLFLTLPNPLPALDAWDAMLATGRRLADLLNADLQDESHSSLIRQRIAQLRDEMRDYDRKQEGR
ncbi:MAG: cell division protein ZipA [Pseudomonadota bacterium]